MKIWLKGSKSCWAQDRQKQVSHIQVVMSPEDVKLALCHGTDRVIIQTMGDSNLTVSHPPWML